jgi:arsenate reductase
MAETFANNFCDGVEAMSAGLEAGDLNPYVVEAMAEIGIDISRNATKTVNDQQIAEGRFDYVVTVCDESSGERCPVVPLRGERVHWTFDDPAAFRGTPDEILTKVRIVRDAIREQVLEWCSTKRLA